MGNAQLKETRTPLQVRQDFARSTLDLEGTGLEFGAYDRPLFDPKTVKLKFIDYYSSEELRAFAARDNVHPENVVAVDHVVKVTNFGAQIDERFEYLVASHVIEHIPDIITWMQNAAEILNPRGRLMLIVPDKRFTFDALRPLTTLEDVLQSFREKRTCAPFSTVFENIYMFRHVDAAAAWDGTINPPDLPGRFDTSTALRHAFDYYERQDRGIHCQVFTSESFLAILDALRDQGLIPFTRVGFEDVYNPGNEFFVTLEKI